uniref:Uncharacterized protein n=1 Tax=Ananas comosus var. bracteatus TaxID=296719 RepID=A0A6V7PEG9_ANACO|nr:unnamed protein product [Ananas comosus var. bracteatus]
MASKRNHHLKYSVIMSQHGTNRSVRFPNKQFCGETSRKSQRDQARQESTPVLPNMDQMDQDEGHNNLNLTEGELRKPENLSRWAKTQNEDKRAAVHDEIARVNQLPSNSSYAVHRMRVLNKLLQLMSIQRTVAQDEELELLFASLNI